MDFIIEDIVRPEDLAKHKAQYEKEKSQGIVTPDAQFTYSWCLVRSSNFNDVKHGCDLLENLFHNTKDEMAKRDYLFYLAVGVTKLGKYDKALKYSKAILEVEPNNHQVQELISYIERKRKKDAAIGAAVVGGVGAVAALAIGGIIGLALSRS